MIKEVIGEDWVRDTPITMETSFVSDLEVESIELVALSEKIQEKYGETVDFPSWLSSMELELFVNGSNLGDEEARKHTSFVKDVAPLPGRNYALGIRSRF